MCGNSSDEGRRIVAIEAVAVEYVDKARQLSTIASLFFVLSSVNDNSETIRTAKYATTSLFYGFICFKDPARDHHKATDSECKSSSMENSSLASQQDLNGCCYCIKGGKSGEQQFEAYCKVVPYILLSFYLLRRCFGTRPFLCRSERERDTFSDKIKMCFVQLNANELELSWKTSRFCFVRSK